MSKFVVMDGKDRILGKFSTCEAAEAARLEYGRIIAHDDPGLFKKFMERTLVVDDPKKKGNPTNSLHERFLQKDRKKSANHVAKAAKSWRIATLRRREKGRP